MTLYGLDPAGDGLNDPAQLREIIDLLKQMVTNLQGMDRANRKGLHLQEELLKRQEEKIANLQRRIELQEKLIEAQRSTINDYQVAFWATHHNDVRRLN